MIIIIDDEEIYEMDAEECPISRFEQTKAELEVIQAAESLTAAEQKSAEMKADFKSLLAREVKNINTRLEMIQALMERI